MIGRLLAALLLSGLLLVAGATGAGADGYGSGDGGGSHYGSTYPVPEAPPAQPTESQSPPVLPRTGSDTGTLVAAGAGALFLGGGFVLLARRRKLALVPS